MKFDILYFPKLDSTNNKALEFLESGADEGLVIVADHQTAGRGRFGRRWVSDLGNLFASITLRPNKPLQNLSEIAFVAAIAIGTALKEYLNDTPINLKYKWPNDILINSQKVAGILIESYSSGIQNIPEGCIVGMGVNIVSHPDFTVFPSNNLSNFSAKPIHRDDLLNLILNHFEEVYYRWLVTGFLAIRDELLDNIYGLGKVIHATSSKGVTHGIFEGLTDDGSVVLKDPQGQCITIRSSEVTFSS
jgi:BirA family biotin operon repressor/biotin-[acetyl-CoA-carboxylase] ligase